MTSDCHPPHRLPKAISQKEINAYKKQPRWQKWKYKIHEGVIWTEWSSSNWNTFGKNYGTYIHKHAVHHTQLCLGFISNLQHPHLQDWRHCQSLHLLTYFAKHHTRSYAVGYPSYNLAPEHKVRTCLLKNKTGEKIQWQQNLGIFSQITMC